MSGQSTLGVFGTKETIVCEMCDNDFPRAKSMRLTSWSDPIGPDTEWCCLLCASKAFNEERR